MCQHFGMDWAYIGYNLRSQVYLCNICMPAKFNLKIFLNIYVHEGKSIRNDRKIGENILFWDQRDLGGVKMEITNLTQTWTKYI